MYHNSMIHILLNHHFNDMAFNIEAMCLVLLSINQVTKSVTNLHLSTNFHLYNVSHPKILWSGMKR